MEPPSLRKISKTAKIFFVLFFISPQVLQIGYCFDLNTAMAQLTALQGKFPISLAELKELATPAVLQKILQGKGILPTLPSLATLTRNDPSQLAKILARLRPSQGRFDPQLEELLSNAFEPRPPNSNSNPASPPPPLRRDPPPQPSFFPQEFPASGEFDDGDGETLVTKRGVAFPPVTSDLPPLITRRGVQRFSSKFRNRHRGGSRRPSDSDYVRSTTAMSIDVDSSESKPDDRTEAPPPFEHITDPNIRNHRLFSNSAEGDYPVRDNYENFTFIDRAEDLMMDESALVPLTPEPPSTTMNSGWVGVMHDQAADEAPILLRDPLKKTTSAEFESHAVNTENYFRPSPADLTLSATSPKFVEAEQDFFTSTIRHQQNSQEEHHDHDTNSNQVVPSYVMPEFPAKPAKNRRKDDRILHKQNYDQQFLSNFAPAHLYPNQKPPLQQQPIPSSPNQNVVKILPYYHPKPANYGVRPPPMTHFGHNSHSFGPYVGGAGGYGPKPQFSPAKLLNKFGNFVGVDSEEQTEATDKVDTGWGSTFFLLGGLVAASAVVAFVLPGFLTMGTAVGKDNDFDDLSGAASESNKDFWNEVKGLYNDLTHIARGDFGHFNKDPGAGSSTIESSSTEKLDGNNGDDDDSGIVAANETTLAFPVNSGYGNGMPGWGGGNGANLTRNIRVSAGRNNTFLREWARVQLHLIDS